MCPVCLTSGFTSPTAIVDHIPNCEKLGAAKYFDWKKNRKVDFPVLCRCPHNTSKPISAYSAANKYIQQQSSSQGWKRAEEQMQQSQLGMHPPTHHSQHSMIQTSATPILGRQQLRVPETSSSVFASKVNSPQEEIVLGSIGLTFNPGNFEPEAFSKPWVDTSAGASSYVQSPGLVEDTSMTAGSWTPRTTFSDTATLQPPSTPAQFHSMSLRSFAQGEGSGQSGISYSLGPDMIQPTTSAFAVLDKPKNFSPVVRRQIVRDPSVPITPQDGLLPHLKACFYSLIPEQDTTGSPALAILQNLHKHNALIQSLNELGRVESQQRLHLKGPLNALLFAYLALAMALTIQDYFKFKLPGQIVEAMQTEIAKLLDHPESPLSKIFQFIPSLFLDGTSR